MEVPRMGMSLVAAAAAVSAGVAFAMMRSTPSETKPLTMVEQLALSPEAFLFWNSTWPGSASFSASMKPWVAASSASCCTSWQMPTVYFVPSPSVLP